MTKWLDAPQEFSDFGTFSLQKHPKSQFLHILSVKKKLPARSSLEATSVKCSSSGQRPPPETLMPNLPGDVGGGRGDTPRAATFRPRVATSRPRMHCFFPQNVHLHSPGWGSGTCPFGRYTLGLGGASATAVGGVLCSGGQGMGHAPLRWGRRGIHYGGGTPADEFGRDCGAPPPKKQPSTADRSTTAQ